MKALRITLATLFLSTVLSVSVMAGEGIIHTDRTPPPPPPPGAAQVDYEIQAVALDLLNTILSLL